MISIENSRKKKKANGTRAKRVAIKFFKSFLSFVLCAAMLLNIPGFAMMFYVEPKWNHMQLIVSGSGEVLSESFLLDGTDRLNRAYNPYTERAELSFSVEYGQPLALEIWTRVGSGRLYNGDPRGEFVGYISGEYDGTIHTFNVASAIAFRGYSGQRPDIETPDPHENSESFVNTVVWDGIVVDASNNVVTLENNIEYVLVLQPLVSLAGQSFANVLTDETEDEVQSDAEDESSFESENNTQPNDNIDNDADAVVADNEVEEEQQSAATPDNAEILEDFTTLDAEPLFTTAGSELDDGRAFLSVKVDRTLPPHSLGTPIGAASPFNALATIPGIHNINIISGNYVHTNVDLAIPGSQTLAFMRTYNSTDSHTGILGTNWRTNFDYILEETNLSVRVTMPDGSRYDFTLRTDGTYIAPEASNMRLEKTNAGFIMTDLGMTRYEFDAIGRIVSITTLGGFATTFTYGANGLSTISGRAGSLTLAYNGGRVSGVTASPGGRSISYEYDARGDLVGYIDPQGQRFTYEYDGRHRLTEFYDGNGNRSLALSYDDFGRVITAYIGNASAPATISYDLPSRTTTTTDATGRQTVYRYNRDRNVIGIDRPSGTHSFEYEQGRVVRETTPDGRVLQFTFDERGNLTSTVNADGSGSRFVYNSMNLPIRVETFAVSGAIIGVVIYEYDTRGNITRETDRNGNIRTFAYDEHNNCISSTDSSGTTRFEYDDSGRLTRVIRPNGEETNRRFDTMGNLVSETTALGHTTSYEYNENGHMTAMIDPLGNRTIYEVDANGRRTLEVDPLGGRTEWAYDTLGNVVTMTDPLGRVTDFVYDASGRLLSETNPRMDRVSYNYDADGRVLSMTDARGNTWRFEYNADGWQTGLIDPHNNRLVGVYDSNGRMISSTDGRGGVSRFQYNTDGHVVRATNPMDGVRQFGHDGNGNVTSFTDENGGTWRYEYDERSNLVSVIDPLNNIVRYEYDAAGRLIAIISATGIRQEYQYDLDGRLVESKDGEGNISIYEYDAMSQLTKVVFPDGTFVENEYDALGRLIRFTNEMGEVTEYFYDASSQLVTFKNAIGAQTHFEYDLAGNLTKVTDALGAMTRYEYDANFNLISVTDALGDTTRLVYDELNRLVTTTDARGALTRYEYDANDNIISVTNPDGGVVRYEYDLNDRVTSINDGFGTINIVYDAMGNILRTTDPLGNVTGMLHDALGRNIGVTMPDGGEIKYEYDADGRLISAELKVDGTSSVAVTRYFYDSNSRVIRVEDALNHSRTFEYNALGQIVAETDENGRRSQFSYDAAGNLVRFTDPMGSLTEFGYDALGRLVYETMPRGNIHSEASRTIYEYDALGRVTAVTDALGNRMSFTHNALGQVLTATDALRNVTHYEYDANGNVVKTTDALGNVSTFRYDSMNRLVGVDTPDGLTRLYTYDTRGLVTRIVDPGRGESFSVYDAAGNLVQQTDANGNVTQYEHDPLGRVSGIAFADGRNVRFAYDLSGQLVEMVDWTGTTSIERDLLGQITKVTDPNDMEIGYTWDPAGNRASVTAPDNSRVSYAYNARNQMISATIGNDVTRYTYFDTTMLRSVTLPNGEMTMFSYDSVGDVVSATDSKDGRIIRDYAYKYDEMRRLVSETRSGIGIDGGGPRQETHEYSYDALGRLSRFVSTTGERVDYTYDAMSNLIREASSRNGATTYAYNMRGQLASKNTPEAEYAFTYDAAGNTVTVMRNGEITRSLEYDSSGRFSRGINASGDITDYTYNGLGHRVNNTLIRHNPNIMHGNNSNSRGTEHVGEIDDITRGQSDSFAWFDESGRAIQEEIITESRNYAVDMTVGGLRDIHISLDGMYDQTLSWGLGLIMVETVVTGEPSVQLTAAAMHGRVYAHANRLGGIAYLTDSDGRLVTYNEFDAWGNAYTEQPEDANFTGLNLLTGFTGYTWDAVLEVHFAQARLYDASNKRFVQPDPIAGTIIRPITINPYLYCINDPVNLIDPTGLSPEQRSSLSLQSVMAAVAVTAVAIAVSMAKSLNNSSQSDSDSHNGVDRKTGAKPQEITEALPPSTFGLVVQTISRVTTVFALEQVFSNGRAWKSNLLTLSSGKNPQAVMPSSPTQLPTTLVGYTFSDFRSGNLGNLSIQAQAFLFYYDKLYSQQLDILLNNPNDVEAMQLMTYFSQQASDVIRLDGQAQVTGHFYDVQIFTQTGPLCWAYSQVMVEAFHSGRSMTQGAADRRAAQLADILYGAGGGPTSRGGAPMNSPDVTTRVAEVIELSDGMKALIPASQSLNMQSVGKFSDLVNALANGPIYGIYSNDAEAHMVVITGAVTAVGHPQLVFSNNPWGHQNIQTYGAFLRGIQGDTVYRMSFRGYLRGPGGL